MITESGRFASCSRAQSKSKTRSDTSVSWLRLTTAAEKQRMARADRAPARQDAIAAAAHTDVAARGTPRATMLADGIIAAYVSFSFFGV